MKKIAKRIVTFVLACAMIVGACITTAPTPVQAATPSVSLTITPTSTGFTVKATGNQTFAAMGATHIAISGPNLYKVHTSSTDLKKSSISWNVTLPERDTSLYSYEFTVKKLNKNGTFTTIATTSKSSSFVLPVSNLKGVKYGAGLKISWTQASQYAQTVYITVKDNTAKSAVYSTSVGRSTTSVVMPKYNPYHSYTITVKNKNKAGYYSIARTYNVLAMP